ncbi:reverse transcriptase domain-containing protein [Tanacetum coccineum]
MTCSTVKRLTKPFDEPEREFQRLKRAAWRLQQNESLAIAGKNLFDTEASSSNNTRAKPPTPPKILHEHSYPNPSGFQNPITLPTKQTGRIVDSRKIWLIQKTCTFQGLRNDPLRHVKHYLSIVDNIQANGAIRDTSRLSFFHFSFKGKAAEWLDRIPPTQIMTWDQLVSQFLDHFFSVGRTSSLRDLILRFKQGDDEPIKRNSINSLNSASTLSPKKRGGIELKILSTIKKRETPEPKAPTFAITTKSGVNTQDPPFPAPSQSTSANHTEGETEKEGHEDAEPIIMKEPVPWPSIFYQPSKSSNLPFLSRLKKQKKDDEDERLLSIFKQIHINLPFLEAMIHMPKGAKVLKDLLSHKEKLEKAASSVKLSEECSAIIQRSLPQKEGDLRSFTLPCLIGPLAVKNALADLGAISKFIFQIDFLVLEMDEDEIVLIILGRPFLAITRAVIDVHEGKLSLRVKSETITFNIGRSMKSKHSHDDYLYCADHTAKRIQEQWVDTVSHDEKWAKEEDEEGSNKAHAVSFYPRTEPIEPLEWKAPKNRLKPSSV